MRTLDARIWGTNSDKPYPLELVARRTRIVHKWRQAHGHGPNVDLVGSEQDWAFWLSLQDKD